MAGYRVDGEAVIVLRVDAFAEQKMEFILFAEDPVLPAMDIIHIHHDVQINKPVIDIIILYVEQSAPAHIDNIVKGVLHRFSVVHGEIVVILGVNHHVGQIDQLPDEMVDGKIRLKATHEDGMYPPIAPTPAETASDNTHCMMPRTSPP